MPKPARTTASAKPAVSKPASSKPAVSKPAASRMDPAKLEKIKNTPNKIQFDANDLGDTEDDEFQEAHVKEVLVTGIPTPLTHKGKNALHWRLTLKTQLQDGSNKTEYISIEEAIDKTTVEQYKVDKSLVPVFINVELQKYGHNNKAPSAAQYTFPIAKGKTVTLKNVCDLVVQKKRNRFRTDSDGNGCLMWDKAVIGDMKSAGYFEAGSNAEITRLGNVKKNEVIGGYIVTYGEGTFF